MQTKQCTKCKEIKTVNEFFWRKDSKKYRNECKKCFSLLHKKWIGNNPGYTKEQSKKWRAENPIKANAICKKYRDSHKEKRYISCTNWRINNPDNANEIQKRCYTKRRKTPKGNLDHRMEVSIRNNLNGNKNGRCWEMLVGYTVEDLKKHLENLFIGDMNWERFLKGEIHIDHVIPKSLFNFKSYEDSEFKLCWSLVNLQPLWEIDNLKKGASVV